MTEILKISERTAETAAPIPANTPYRVMLVDDSSVVRGLITRALESHKNIQVVASASDGAMAVNLLKTNPADVIILDIEMPVMDGLTALPKLLAVNPAVKIIIASTLSLKNAEISLRALSLGAADYLPKPTSTRDADASRTFQAELIEKILALGAAARKSGAVTSGTPASLAKAPTESPAARPGERSAITPAQPKPPVSAPIAPRSAPAGKVSLRPPPQSKPDIIMIGSSTGGPQALFQVIKGMGKLPQPVLITQHMPPSFTTILAEHISKQCEVACIEAKNDQEARPETYYVAPGDYHMAINKRFGNLSLSLNQDPHENFCRPAVDPMLRSGVAAFGGKVLVVILTGMGQDGLKGSEKVVEAGGAVIAQDEATSVVWGMPGAVANAGICSAVMPVGDIGLYVRKIALGGAA